MEVEQRGDSLVLVMHVGVTKSSSAHVVSSKGVDVLGCEQVVVDDTKWSVFFLVDREVPMSVFLCDIKPSTLAPGTSAEGDPQSNGAAERSRNVTKGHVRSIKPAVGSASGVDVPADRKKGVWEGAPLFSQRSLVNGSGGSPLDCRFEQGRIPAFGVARGRTITPPVMDGMAACWTKHAAASWHQMQRMTMVAELGSVHLCCNRKRQCQYHHQ